MLVDHMQYSVVALLCMLQFVDLYILTVMSRGKPYRCCTLSLALNQSCHLHRASYLNEKSG